MNNCNTPRATFNWKVCETEDKLNLGDDLKKYISTTITDIVCEKPIPGIEINADPRITNLIDRTSFYRQKRQAEFLLSYLGYCGWGKIIEDGKTKLVNFHILASDQYSTWGEIDSTTYFANPIQHGVLWLRYYRNEYDIWSYELYTVETNTEYSEDFVRELIEENRNNIAVVSFKGKNPPFMMFYNTFSACSDLDNVSNNTYELLNKLSNETLAVWEWNKTMWVNNGLNGGIKSSEDITNKVMKGKGRLLNTSNTMNALGGPAISPLTAGASQEALLQNSLIGVLLDTAYKFTFSMREVMAGGTNKHNLENVKIDENSLTHLKNKLIIRSNQYTELFRNVFGIKASKTISLQPNDFSTYKLESADTTTIPNIQLDGVKIKAKNTLDAITLKGELAEKAMKENANAATPPQENIQEKITI